MHGGMDIFDGQVPGSHECFLQRGVRQKTFLSYLLNKVLSLLCNILRIPEMNSVNNIIRFPKEIKFSECHAYALGLDIHIKSESGLALFANSPAA